MVIAAGAREARGITAEAADGPGVVFALDYLTQATRGLLGGEAPGISAQGLDVVVIGGGDTGNDCLGTAVRQGARSVRQLEFLSEPPETPRGDNAWPEWPNVKKTDYGQQEAIDLMGCEMRQWAVDTIRVERDASGAVSGLAVVDLDWSEGTPRRIASSERIVPAQLVLIACGFTGPEARLFETLDVKVTGPRNLPVTVGGASHRCIMHAAGPRSWFPPSPMRSHARRRLRAT